MTPEMTEAVDAMVAAAQRLATVHKEPGQAVIAAAIATGAVIIACSVGNREAAEAMHKVVCDQIFATFDTGIRNGIAKGLLPAGVELKVTTGDPAAPEGDGQ